MSDYDKKFTVKFVLLVVLLVLVPVAAFSATRIMPLGDSITYDSYTGDPRLPGQKTGYRQLLWTLLSNAGYDVDFVGSQVAGQNAVPVFDADNAGFPGISAYRLANLLETGFWYNTGEQVTPGPYFDYFPADVILLHIGTNDLSVNVDDVERILDIIDDYSTSTRVVIARIIDKVPHNQTVTAFNDALESLVNMRIIDGDLLTLVDMEEGAGLKYVIGYDMVDAGHPLTLGYEKMANVWFEALVNLLPEPPWSPPEILSTPVLQAISGFPYHYQVQARGFPINYRLISAPNGMMVNEDTGLIEWVPDTTGIFEVTVEFSNTLGSDTQNFFITVDDTILTDNGGAGTTAVGTWLPSGGLDYYGTQSVYSNSAGAIYSFERAYTGTAEVALWWTEYANRCDNVTVRVYDGGTLLDDTIRVNQLADGGQWNPVGVYTFSDTARVVIVSSGGCTTNVDAVRFSAAAAPDLVNLQVEGPASVDEGTAAQYTATAFFADGSERVVSASAAWSTSCPAYSQISSQGLLTAYTVEADQSCDVSVQYSQNGTTRTASTGVTIHNLEQGAQTFIDNGGSGTTAVGDWLPSGGLDYYGTQSLYSNSAGATYSFERAYTGTAEVALWWTEYANRCNSVTVRVYDGTTLLDNTIRVNQLADGGQWNPVGVYTFSDTARVVIVSSGGCTTNADAVRFSEAAVPDLVDLQVEGPAGVDEGTEAQYTATAFYADGSERVVSASAAWSTSCPAYSQISSQGLLTAAAVETDQSCEVGAQYTQNGTTRMASAGITIYNLEQGAQTFIDNGGSGTTAAGNWLPSGGLDYYGTQSLYSNSAGATYSFERAYTGTAQVALWWTEYANRCDNVTVRVYDGTTLLDDTIRVNQLNDGGQWNPVGIYSFSGTARVVIVSSGSCTTNADAVRLSAVELGAQTFIDNGGSGTTAAGNWLPSGGIDYYGTQSVYSNSAGATYTFARVYSGMAQVALWWTEYANRCDNVKVRVYDGTTLLDDTIRVNQLYDGGQWNPVGTYTFNDTARVVIVSSGSCTTNADAVRLTAAAP